jgi:hypothetical protein
MDIAFPGLLLLLALTECKMGWIRQEPVPSVDNM